MKSRGFTLIELIIVIAVIGLLGSLLLPAISRARAKAKANEREQHRKEMLEKAWKPDNKGW